MSQGTSDAGTESLPRDWHDSGEVLVRTVEFRSFPDLLATLARVERVAESVNHHPDVEITWRPPVRTPQDDPTVRLPAVLTLALRCYTHTTRTVSAADRRLAVLLEAALP